MAKECENFVLKLQHYSPKKIIGAVKTFPLQKLLNMKQQMEECLGQPERLQSCRKDELEAAREKLQLAVRTRLDTSEKLIQKFTGLSPEVISLENSVFSLVSSRDLLEDVRAANIQEHEWLKLLSKTSINILEAVNIQIQQRFSHLSPESIAVIYSDDQLNSYRRLLKSLLIHIEVDSDIFRVYSEIIRHVVEGSRIHEHSIAAARVFCRNVFENDPPDFEGVFNTYTMSELEVQQRTLQSALKTVQHDISRRPSILELEEQCRQILEAMSRHVDNRKILMRETTRVLHLSHYLSFVEIDSISENASTILMLCQVLFNEIADFLASQREHLDVSLNLTSINDAVDKVKDALHYRQFAIGQLFLEFTRIPVGELRLLSVKHLDDAQLLLQEVQAIVEDYLQRTPGLAEFEILVLSEMLQDTIQKLQKVAASKASRAASSFDKEAWEYDRSLPSLSKFYDEDLLILIRKALSIENRSAMLGEGQAALLKSSPLVPLTALKEYVESFLDVTKFRDRL
ncbi:hypothetical protein CSB45_01415 [candidate division KSB3 bacterium]|uniref:Uncharacterized protein n=1 Tax=candidate division KSB3 bacterium TaxID=2044937 RepID=A0A2G6EAH0_9BACT|nr:MAG: hypothetical protein CSB45_01415 [candidate division KSB3 bacterium]